MTKQRGLRLGQVRKIFPEATESDKFNEPGWGPSFFVYCPFGHKKGRVQANIRIEDGTFHCHDCDRTVDCYAEWGIHPDDHHLDSFLPNKSLEVQTEGYTAMVMADYTGPTWGVGDKKIKAPGETVLLSSLKSDHPAIIYLRDRGCDMKEILSLPPTLQLHYCTNGVFSIAKGLGSTSGRIIYPIFFNTPKGADGRFNPVNPVGWQARQIDRVIREDEVVGEKEVWNGFGWRKFQKKDGYWEDRHVPKYYTMPSFRKTDVLYNFDLARQYSKVAVVEGVMDVMSVGPACVGTFGMFPSLAQINLLKTYWDEVVLIRDPGVSEEHEKFKKVLDELTGVRVTHLTLAGSRDPGSTSRTSIWQQIAEAEHAKTQQHQFKKN